MNFFTTTYSTTFTQIAVFDILAQTTSS